MSLTYHKFPLNHFKIPWNHYKVPFWNLVIQDHSGHYRWPPFTASGIKWPRSLSWAEWPEAHSKGWGTQRWFFRPWPEEENANINKDGPFLRECSSLFINIVIHCSYSFFENMFHMFCFNIFFRIIHYLGLEMVREVFLLWKDLLHWVMEPQGSDVRLHL